MIFPFVRATTSAAILLCLSVSIAGADLVQVDYTGTLSGATSNIAGTFSAGQLLSGTLVFDSDALPLGGATVNSAIFNAILSHSFTISGGSTSYSAFVPSSPFGLPEIQIDNAGGGFPTDRFAVLSRASEGLTGASVGGFALNSFGFRFDDSSNTIFSSALALPTNLSDADFDSGAFFLFFGPNLEELAFGSMTSMTFTTVPEPSSGVLMISMLAGLALRRSRRSL